MPIYEYKCDDCGAHIEKMQRVSDAPLTVCKNCGGKLEKQLSLSGFQFKGEGWYVTDYSKKSSGGKETKPETKSEKSGEKSSPGDSTAKPDSASNKTTETKTASKKE